MIDRPYDPWKKGPAVVLPFPQCWIRAWVVRPIGDGNFRGEVHGEDFDGPKLTGDGPLHLVLAALVSGSPRPMVGHPGPRRGLPVVVLTDVETVGSAAA